MKASITSLLTIFGLSMLIATPAKSEMINIAASKDGQQEYYIDSNSMTIDRNFVEASVKTDNKNLFSSGVSASIARWKINCSNKSKMVIRATFYGLNGNILQSQSIRKPSGWNAITPRSMGEIMYSSMCNRSKR